MSISKFSFYPFRTAKNIAQQRAAQEKQKREIKKEKEKKNAEKELERQIKKTRKIKISRRNLDKLIKPPVNNNRKKFPNALKALNDDEYNQQLNISLKAYDLTITKMNDEIDLVLKMEPPNIKKLSDIDDEYLSKIDDDTLYDYAHRIEFLINFLKKFYIKEDTDIEIEFIQSTEYERIIYKDPTRKTKLNNLINEENKSIINKIIDKLKIINNKKKTLIEEYYSLNEIVAMVSIYRYNNKVKTGARVATKVASLVIAIIPGAAAAEIAGKIAGEIAGPTANVVVKSVSGMATEEILEKAINFMEQKIKRKKLNVIDENSNENDIEPVINTKPILKDYCKCDKKKYKQDVAEWLEKHRDNVNHLNFNNENSNNESISPSRHINGGNVKTVRKLFSSSRKKISRARSAP